MKEYKEKEDCRVDYEAADINGKLALNLRGLSHKMRFVYDDRSSQNRILMMLNEKGSMTQKKLTKRLEIQPGSASEVIAKLEGAGLIRRTPSEKDHRTADIEITEAGKAQAETAREGRESRHGKMFSCLTEEEKKQLLVLLEKVNADWEEHVARDAERRHGHRGHCHGERGGEKREGRHGEHGEHGENGPECRHGRHHEDHREDRRGGADHEDHRHHGRGHGGREEEETQEEE